MPGDPGPIDDIGQEDDAIGVAAIEDLVLACDIQDVGRPIGRHVRSTFLAFKCTKRICDDRDV